MAAQGDRKELAKRRLLRVLGNHGLALMRTLEQKISDSGPYDQRIDPHVLTTARGELRHQGDIASLRRGAAYWFHLSETSQAVIGQRLALQEPVHTAIQKQNFLMRVGQALEIAVFKALCTQDSLQFFGHFRDLDAHGDDQLYSREEPPSAFSGKEIPNRKRFDFLALHPSAGIAGIEVKNTREWLYPSRDEILDLLWKCCHLDAVPVLIGRRIPFVTFKVLYPCGLVIHQTYNQRFPAADHELATRAKDKNLLGYHDIRLGNEPDPRLLRFIEENLPKVLPGARQRFDRFKDLVCSYASGEMAYEEFAARVRRRQAGTDEDSDWNEEAPDEEAP